MLKTRDSRYAFDFLFYTFGPYSIPSLFFFFFPSVSGGPHYSSSLSQPHFHLYVGPTCDSSPITTTFFIHTWGPSFTDFFNLMDVWARLELEIPILFSIHTRDSIGFHRWVGPTNLFIFFLSHWSFFLVFIPPHSSSSPFIHLSSFIHLWGPLQFVIHQSVIIFCFFTVRLFLFV